ncbi:MAG: lasso peptide biosynthesis B2 protein [Gemmatimonadales bacterium]
MSTVDEVRTPSLLLCVLLIFVIKCSLKALGFSRTITSIRRRTEGIPERSLRSPDGVMSTERVVALAAALYPGRAKCLERSLALYYLLRCQGVPVRYRQGIHPYPFQAHAWIEYGGEVINDVPEHVRKFARLPDELS